MVDLIKGKYRIVREIARSNDIVYEAQDTVLGRRIALKELNFAPNLTGQAKRERIERFNREARAAGRLSHPNIVSIYDFGEENGRHFIAMEFLEGQTLRDMMQVRGSLPLKEAINIACQVLEALGYAHANRVIHRDIKPDNIHILPGGQVKLADFGIARLTEEPSLTSDGQVFGTPSYMSPEQIEGRGIDYRSDLFSLGVLLYEMLTGRKPFTGDSVVAITYAVMNAEPPPMGGVPMGVEQVIRRAMAKNPAQRQASAEQMRQDLRNAEQIPPLFFPPANATHMGNTGMGAYPGAAPSYPPSGAPLGGGTYAGSTGYGANTGYGMGVPGAYSPMPQGAASQAAGAQSGSLPWSWNMPGGNTMASQGMAGQSPMPGGANSGPLTSAGGIYPYASPPFPAPPREPLIVLSPAARTTLLSILGAVVLGTALALGVLGVQHKYQDFQTNVIASHVASLMAEGKAAYDGKDFATAAQRFESALNAGPNDQQRRTILTNLGYIYLQLARIAKATNLQQARTYYETAIKYSPDYGVAHTELSVLLESMGDHHAAQEQQVQAQASSGVQNVPTSLDNSLQNATEPTSNIGPEKPYQDPNQFSNENRNKAQQLLQEGDALANKGDVDGAIEKWNEVIRYAPGTELRDIAMKRINTNQSSPNFDGNN